MKNLIKTALIAIIFSISSSVLANDEIYANLTDATIKIVDNGEVVHEVSLLLLDKKKATVTFLDEITKKPVSQLRVTSNKTHTQKRELISLEMEYLSFQNSVWVSKTNSSILNEAGKEGMISIFSDANSLDMIITAYSRDNEILKTDSRIINVNNCKQKNNVVADALAVEPSPMAQGCCSSSCEDGSGRTLT